MGFRSFWPKDGPEVCWRRSGSVICREYPSELTVDDAAPAESIALDPEIGFEVQKFIAFYALLNLPESYKQDWINMMRIFRLGDNTNPFTESELEARWVDPLSGQSYVARRYGQESIDGRMVDRGIAARMLDWMNALTLQAYEVGTRPGTTDPMTTESFYVKRRTTPVVISQRFANRVRSYQAPGLRAGGTSNSASTIPTCEEFTSEEQVLVLTGRRGWRCWRRPSTSLWGQ